MTMLYRQVFKTYEGARKRAAFERAHAGDRGNVNYRFYIVRCDLDGRPDGAPYHFGKRYCYRIERSLLDHPTDPRTYVASGL
jgi:hypothetical protein